MSIPKNLRKNATKKIENLKSLLGTIEWTQTSSREPIITKGRTSQINSELEDLYDNTTLQQFIYDTDDIQGITSRLQPLAMISWMRDTELSQKAKIVAHKLLAHQAYSIRELYPLAVANLIELDTYIRLQSGNSLQQMSANWYRMFMIDHAIARMYSCEIALVLPDDINSGNFQATRDRVRSDLLQEFESLSHENFKKTNVSSFHDLNEQTDPYLLRQAHYFGHRGNDHLNQLQNTDWSSLSIEMAKETNQHDKLIDDGLIAYDKAIKLRLVAFNKSFVGKLSDLHLDDREEFQSVKPWSEEWKLKNEAFFVTSQALADIANQYAARSCVLCYKYLLSVYQSGQANEDILSQAKLYLEKAKFYWRKANINGTQEGIGEPYRIAARRRLAEHMVFIASKGTSGLPISYYEKSLAKWEHDIFIRFAKMERMVTGKDLQ